jgi:RNA polymerase sigma factor (sigma-70 family)
MTTTGTASREDCEQAIVEMLDMLYRSALRLTRNPADAEDLVAESVAKALASLDSLKDPKCLRGWIFRVMHNTHTSMCRKRATRREVSLDAAPDDDDVGGDFWLFDRLHQPFLLWWGNPEQTFLDNLLREDIERALEKLPDTYRQVVVMADVEEFTYEEIAAALNMPVGTVRSRLSRGRSMLQKALWQQAKDAGLGAACGNRETGNT